MGAKLKNNAYGRLIIGISASDVTITLDAGNGARFPTLTTGEYFYATLVDTANNLEIVKVTARVNDVLTVVRGQDNTTARAYQVNDRIEQRMVTALFNEKLDASVGYGDTTNPYTSKTAKFVLAAPNAADGLPTFRALVASDIEGTVATVTGTQTLTNKTISGSDNTLSNIGNSSLTNSSITINGTAVSLGGSVTTPSGTVTSVGGTGSVNGITLTGTVTSSGNLTLGGTLGSITNSQLTNSSITINGSSISLGGSVTTPQGTVTSVTGTAPVVSSGGTTPAISMAQSSGSANGWLSSVDWTTFNGKQAALGFTPYNSTNPSNYIALGSAITGYTAGSNTALAATDTLLASLGKIQGQINARGTGNGTVTSVTATSPVTSTGGTTPVIAMPAATTSVNGYLTSTDWNTFNGKGQVNSITSTDGSVTITGTSTVNLSVAVAGSTNNLLAQVRNNTGATLTKGTVVYINGAVGQLPTVAKALATGDATSAQTLGMMTADLANNSNGNVTIIGTITNINTSAFTDGQQLYLSPTVAGTFTATKPHAPDHIVYVGIVEHAHPSQGEILVRVQNGWELDELHDVSAQSPTNGQTLIYNETSGLWQKNNLTQGTGITISNGAGTITVANSSPMTYPSTGIPNSTGSAWGTSYGVTGTGSVALNNNPIFATNITVNGVNVGRGDGNVATNTAFGFDAIGSPNIISTNINNVGIGYNALNVIGAGIATLTISPGEGGSGYQVYDSGSESYVSDFNALVQLIYSSGSTAVTYPFATITVVGGVVTSAVVYSAFGSGGGFLNTSTVMTFLPPEGPGFGSGALVRIGTLKPATDVTAIGYNAGTTCTSNSNSIYIGSGATGTGNNEIVIGQGVVGGGDNTAVIGNSNTVSTTVRGTLIGFGSVVLTGVSDSTISLGTGITTGNIDIGNTSSSAVGTISIGRSTGSQTVTIAGGTVGNSATKTINIGTNVGTTQTSSTVNINIGNSVGVGTLTFGRSINTQTVNVATGANTGTKTVNIGTNSAAGGTTAITIGATAGTSTTTLNGTVTAVNDMTINGLRVGKGPNNITANTAIGAFALNSTSNSGDGYNTAIGVSALRNNITGSYNTAIGVLPLWQNSSGVSNMAIGVSALAGNISGGQNTGIGNNALLVTTNSNNTAIGFGALSANTSGSGNLGIGNSVGATLTTGINNTLIGTSANVLANNNNNSVVIGSSAVGLGSNTTVIGNSSTTSTRIYGNLTTQVGTGPVRNMPYIIAQTGVPVIMLSSATNITSTGAITGLTALEYTPTGVVKVMLWEQAGLSLGVYYARFSSTTACQVYSDAAGTIPLSGITAGPYTNSGAINGYAAFIEFNTIPANSLGPNGRLRCDAMYGNNNSGNNKSFSMVFGGATINSFGSSSLTFTRQFGEIANRGATNRNVFNPYTAYASTVLTEYTNIDTTIDQSLYFIIKVATGATADYVILHSYSIQVLPS